MPCLRPLTMYPTGRFTASGKPEYTMSAPKFQFDSSLCIPVPCRKCEGCRDDHRREWIKRLNLEAMSTPHKTFLTLTYNNSNLPDTLDYTHIQLFLKRLRKVLATKIKFFVAGEYGKLHNRPHWHMLLFGVDLLTDDYGFRLVGFDSANPRFSSVLIEKLWSFGFNVAGSVNGSSISYVSKYICKDNSLWRCSNGIGIGQFVDIRRVGRKVDYKPVSHFEDICSNGKVAIESTIGYKTVGIPHVFLRYLTRTNPNLAQELKASAKKYLQNLPLRDTGRAEDYLNHQLKTTKTKEKL